MSTISVIITTHNRKYEVRRAIDSVYAQEIMPDEVILVDDHSVDGTKEYIETFEYSGLKYIEVCDGNDPIGPGAARNVGIRSANSNYIAFLDSDNEWYPSKLSLFKKAMEEHSFPDIIFSRYIYLERFNHKIKPYALRKKYIDINVSDKIVVQSCIDASSAIFSKNLLVQCGGYDETLSTNIDWELVLRVRQICSNLSIIELSDVLTKNNTMYDSISENIELELCERIKIIKKYQSVFRTIDDRCRGAFFDAFKKDINVRMDDRVAVSRLLTELDKSELKSDIFLEQIESEKELQNELARKNSFYSLLFRWLDKKNKGIKIDELLLKRGICRIAIYGAGNHGKLLMNELADSDVKVCYFLDKNSKMPNVEDKNGNIIAICKPDENCATVDAVIVSTYLEMEKIRLPLEQRGFKNVISMYDIV